MLEKKSASRHTLKPDLRRVDKHAVKAREYKELPEVNGEMLKRAVVKKGAPCV